MGEIGDGDDFLVAGTGGGYCLFVMGFGELICGGLGFTYVGGVSGGSGGFLDGVGEIGGRSFLKCGVGGGTGRGFL